ncbi:hypothetical protein D187_007550 [Cystobacter fuscus DSM 2262]|uniref:Uncharacterized protein n=1 Tax=Cystobacter fuscus (strain ATCC 25194 / DSM 2262 / NBRC 100088 / M29) TaxID=1242864 RepID=S9QIC8_CYSF2|nr:hypothetical protein D187_007550 [Cystobacter fuscus DSM 2262]
MSVLYAPRSEMTSEKIVICAKKLRAPPDATRHGNVGGESHGSEREARSRASTFPEEN